MPPRALYHLFPWVGRTSCWASRRLPPAGRLIAGLLICGFLFGVDFRQTLAYQVACLSFALLLSSLILSVLWRPKLSVTRILPERVTSGITMRYFIEITNHGRRAERDLVLRDEVKRPRISYDHFQHLRAGSRKTNWLDRAVGFPRWVELMRQRRGIELEMTPVPPIPAGGRVRVAVEATPTRRGWINFESTHIFRPDPLTLFHAQTLKHGAASLLSLPIRYSAPPIPLHSERHYQKGGVSLAHAVGDSQEFASLRDYRPGDPRRHIHWRSFARTGRLIVKEYQDEYFDRHALVLDTYLGDIDRAVFESMVSVAASIAAGERPRDSILDVIFAGTEIVQLTTGRGLGDSDNALDYLAEAQPAISAGLEQLATLLRERAAQLASLIIICAQRNEEPLQLIDRLAAQGIPCISIFLIDENAALTEPEQRGAHTSFELRHNHIGEDLAQIGLIK